MSVSKWKAVRITRKPKPSSINQDCGHVSDDEANLERTVMLMHNPDTQRFEGVQAAEGIYDACDVYFEYNQALGKWQYMRDGVEAKEIRAFLENGEKLTVERRSSGYIFTAKMIPADK